jgi:hypothetical protein
MDAEEFYHALDMQEQQDAIRLSKQLLAKLNVKDLRVLAKKYFKIDDRDAKTWSKATLVHELSLEYGEDILDEMWKHGRKRRDGFWHQDGGCFYVYNSLDAYKNCGACRVATYPKKVTDHDIEGAQAARQWFLTEWCPANAVQPLKINF